MSLVIIAYIMVLFRSLGYGMSLSCCVISLSGRFPINFAGV